MPDKHVIVDDYSLRYIGYWSVMHHHCKSSIAASDNATRGSKRRLPACQAANTLAQAKHWYSERKNGRACLMMLVMKFRKPAVAMTVLAVMGSCFSAHSSKR